MKAIILAGGKGTRLKNLTKENPKPLIDVGGQKLIDYNLKLLSKYKIYDFIITLNYLPQRIVSYFKRKKSSNKIFYYIEDAPLGTAGAIYELKDHLKNTFIVCSSDTIIGVNVKDLIRFHKTHKGIATICIYKHLEKDAKSKIIIDKNFRIKKFVERPKNISSNAVWSNASFYIFDPAVLNYFVPGKQDFGYDIFPKLLKNNEKIYAFNKIDYFIDVGSKKKVKKAELILKRYEK